MTLDELNNLDPNNIGSWPLPVRAVIIIIICVVIAFGAWKMDITNQRVQHEKLVKQEMQKKDTFEKKQKQAANLEALKKQMQVMKQSFGDLLQQLPNKTEVPGLIVDISQTGLAAGLEFNLFKPAKERPAEFYAELPISISVEGTYHQLGEFVSGLAALPRIVTTHNINITKSGKAAKGGKKDRSAGAGDLLLMNATAKTYRALDEEESG